MHRRLWSVATALHDVHADHAPLHSATFCFQLVVVPSPICCIHVFRGRPGSLRQFIPEQQPDFIAMTCFKAWCAGTLLSSLTMCPTVHDVSCRLSAMFSRPAVDVLRVILPSDAQHLTLAVASHVKRLRLYQT